MYDQWQTVWVNDVGRIVSWRAFSKAWKAALWGPMGWKRGWGFGRGSQLSPHQLGGLEERIISIPAPPLPAVWQSVGRPTGFIDFKCKDDVWCCILGAFCTEKLMQCNVEKALLGFWMSRGITTVTVRCTKRTNRMLYSYTSNLWLPVGVLSPSNQSPLWYGTDLCLIHCAHCS